MDFMEFELCIDRWLGDLCNNADTERELCFPLLSGSRWRHCGSRVQRAFGIMLHLECADGGVLGIQRHLLSRASAPLADVCELAGEDSCSFKVPEASVAWLLVVQLLGSLHADDDRARPGLGRLLSSLDLRSAKLCVHIAHKWAMLDLLSELDAWLSDLLPPHLSMHSNSHGYLPAWLALADQGGLPRTLNACMAAVGDPASGLMRRGLLAELAHGPGGAHAPPCGCSECGVQQELGNLSAVTLVKLVRAVATAGRAIQKHPAGQPTQQTTQPLPSQQKAPAPAATSHVRVSSNGADEGAALRVAACVSPTAAQPWLCVLDSPVSPSRQPDSECKGGALRADSMSEDPAHSMCEAPAHRPNSGGHRASSGSQQVCGPACWETGVCMCSRP